MKLFRRKFLHLAAGAAALPVPTVNPKRLSITCEWAPKRVTGITETLAYLRAAGILKSDSQPNRPNAGRSGVFGARRRRRQGRPAVRRRGHSNGAVQASPVRQPTHCRCRRHLFYLLESVFSNQTNAQAARESGSDTTRALNERS
jgi:hypothetical protein